jgi:hypothetical protein
VAGETQTSQSGAPATPAAQTIHVVTAPQAPTVSRQETNAFVMRLIGHHGNAENALAHLAGEQLRFRKRAQRAERQASELQKQLPAAGAVVLTGDDAKAFTEFRAANPTFKVTDLSQTVKDLAEHKSKAVKDSRAAALKTAAGKKYKLNVLSMALGDTPLEFKKVLQQDPEAEEGEDTMIEVDVPYVKNGDTLELLDTWLTRERKDFTSIIANEEDESETEERQSRDAGPRLPKQTPSVPAKAGGKAGKKADILKAVDRSMSKFVLPSQRNKPAGKGT